MKLFQNLKSFKAEVENQLEKRNFKSLGQIGVVNIF